MSKRRINKTAVIVSTAVSQFHRLAAGLAIDKMFRGTCFFITEFDAVAKLLDCELDDTSKDYLALRVLHCVDWDAMEPVEAAEVRRVILECLGYEATERHIGLKLVRA